MKNFEVSFNSPQCGWMSIGFDDGVNEFHTTTAHAPHERALPELLNILTDLLDANSTENKFVLKWNRNPEEFDFEFQRDGKSVNLQIFQYPTEKRETKNREKVYDFTGDILKVCAAFHQTFAQMETDRDVDEFEQNWHQPFPHQEFEKFESVLQSART